MNVVFLRWIAAFAGLTAAVANAQSQPGASPDTGSLVRKTRPAQIQGESTVAARITLKEFGACTVSRAPNTAAAVVNMPVDSSAFDKALRRLVTEDCLSAGELTMPSVLLRASIFEALYARGFGRGANPDFKSVPPFDYAAGYSRPLSEDAQQTIALAIVGDCVSRTVPLAAHRLVTSNPGSQLESDSVSAVARELPGCVPPRQTFHFSRSVLRAAVAEALYRLSTSSRHQAERG